MTKKNHSPLLCAPWLLAPCSAVEGTAASKGPQDRLARRSSPLQSAVVVSYSRANSAHLVTLRARTSRSSIAVADNKLERPPALADELVRLKVDVLFTPAGAMKL